MSCVAVRCLNLDCRFQANHNGCHHDTEGRCPYCGRKLLVEFDEQFDEHQDFTETELEEMP